MAAGRRTKTAKSVPKESPAAPVESGHTLPEARYPIVGIGASAGGLEAFEQFFRAMKPDSGIAFVLVPHLDPGHASILSEILQRSTRMPVIEAQDQMAVLPNRVHIIPPNRDMAILRGTLLLSVPDVPRGQRMPIDAFLRSLAEDQGERAIGIILSGTGTDGTLGLRAIVGAGGVTLVQDPGTARYDGMPSSAIQSGYATHVLAPDKMPAALLSGMRALTNGANVPIPAVSESAPTAALNKLLVLVRSATGHDFSLYKKSTIGRRIERRMAQHDILDIEVYTRYLKEHPTEVQALFKELLINVTSFFRDPEAFVILRQTVMPRLLADKPPDYVFRAWVAGCATGEEAYSVAILLREYMDESRAEFKVQLYSTDLDEDAISVARAGIYPPNIAADVTPERLRRFFVKEDAGFRVKKEIREMVVFAIQNVIKDPPFTKLDLLCCRNLMIYLEPELQARLVPAFHYALKPDGVLFLSPSESIGNHPELFTPINRKWKFYQAMHTTASTRSVMTGGLSWAAETAPRGHEDGVKKNNKEINFAELTRRVLLQSYAPASVVTDAKGTVMFVHGETGKYLRPAPGQASLNLVEMAREGLQMELRAAIHNAATQGSATVGREVSVKTNGDFQPVALSVRPLPDPDGGPGLILVSFLDVKTPPADSAEGGAKRRRASLTADARRIAELERDLAYTRENLQATIEEQQASNEELKSTNEELQSTNEELQSTNEELETSKEELQSVNEELITVNAELQAKIEQLAGMQNDMKNLLDNINIGTIFLDHNLVIRRFTREATQVYRLVGTDIGRPLADIKSNLDGDDVLSYAQGVLDTLVPWQREVRASGGKWFLAHIQPYRTLDNVIEGVVLTFSDITAFKLASDQVRTSEARLAAAQHISGIGTWEFDVVAQRVTWSSEMLTIFGVGASRAPTTMQDVLAMIVSDDRDAFVETLRVTIETGRPFDFQYRIARPDGTTRRVRDRGEAIARPDKTVAFVVGTVLDITESDIAEGVLRRSEESQRGFAHRLGAVLEALPDIVVEIDAGLRISWMNPAAQAFFGKDAVGRKVSDWGEPGDDWSAGARSAIEGASDDATCVESWQRRSDGQRRLLAWRFSALRDDAGRATGIVSSGRDITELRPGAER